MQAAREVETIEPDASLSRQSDIFGLTPGTTPEPSIRAAGAYLDTPAYESLDDGVARAIPLRHIVFKGSRGGEVSACEQS